MALEHWADIVGEGQIPREAIERLRGLPAFDDALRQSVSGALSFYDSNPKLHRNIKDMGRLILGIVALYLDATGGLTHRRLRELSRGAGFMSAGRATAMLWQLLHIGYVRRDETPINGRSHRYVPTEEMLAAFKGRFRIDAEAFALLDPDAAEALSRFDEPAFFQGFVAELGRRGIDAVINPQAALNPLAAYSERTAGMLVLYALTNEADRGGPFPAVGPVSFSVTALSRRFQISRAHLRNLLLALADAGYYRQQGDGAGYLEPSSRDAFQAFHAFGLIGIGCCLHAGLLAARHGPAELREAGISVRSSALVEANATSAN